MVSLYLLLRLFHCVREVAGHSLQYHGWYLLVQKLSRVMNITGFLQLLGIVSLALLLFIFRSFLSYLRPVRVGDHFARPFVVTI